MGHVYDALYATDRTMTQVVQMSDFTKPKMRRTELVDGLVREAIKNDLLRRALELTRKGSEYISEDVLVELIEALLIKKWYLSILELLEEPSLSKEALQKLRTRFSDVTWKTGVKRASRLIRKTT